MDLATTTPNLRGLTREYAGDPTTGRAAANPRWVDATVDEKINMALQEMAAAAGLQTVGYGLCRTYMDTVADQIYYEKPSDYMSLHSVEVETEGGDLSAKANPVIAKPTPFEEHAAMQLYNDGKLTEGPRYYFEHHRHIGIVAPPDTVGTKAMRWTYTASLTALVATTDVPAIDLVHHELICIKAAIRLLMSRQLDYSDLLILHGPMDQQYKMSLSENIRDTEGQIEMIRRKYKRPFKFGRKFVGTASVDTS